MANGDKLTAIERALPFAAVAETILTKGKSPGTTSLGQLDRIDRQRLQERQLQRQTKLDESNAITRQLQQEALGGRIGEAKTKANLIEENKLFDDALRKQQDSGELGLTFSSPAEKVAFKKSPLQFIDDSVLGKTQTGKIEVAKAQAGIKAEQPKTVVETQILEKKLENIRTPEQLADIAAQKQVTAQAAQLQKVQDKEALKQARLGRSVKGLEPIPGINITPDSVKKVKESFKSFKIINGLMQQMQSEFQRSGGEILPGKVKAKMQSITKDIQLELKELVNLGVLNGPDLVILQGQIPDPTGLGVNIERGLAGIIGGGDPIQAKFDTFQGNLQRKLDANLEVNGFRIEEEDTIVDENEALLDELGL